MYRFRLTERGVSGNFRGLQGYLGSFSVSRSTGRVCLRYTMAVVIKHYRGDFLSI